MCTPKRGMNIPIQNVITFINDQQSITGISRNIVHQGPHQNAVCVTGLLRKKYLDKHVKILSEELTEECPSVGKSTDGDLVC